MITGIVLAMLVVDFATLMLITTYIVTASQRMSASLGMETVVKFRVELVWKDGDESAASSIFLTSDGRVILQGRAVSQEEI